MPGFDTHTLDVLEYPKIVSILKGLCLTRYGMELLGRVAPSTDIDSIRTRLDEISEMKDIVLYGDAFPISRLEDTTDLVKKSRTEGMRLEPKTILRIRELIEVSGVLHGYAKSGRVNFPSVAEYLAMLHPFPEILKEIDKAIDKTGEILDSASAALKRLRADIYDLKNSIAARLQRILSRRQKSPGWQDDTITIRDNRYVIPVIAGQFRSDSGIIHDRSQSGSTLYVEPNEIVEANNRLGLLVQEERLEIDRILRRITSMIGEASSRLLSNCEIVGVLDFLHAAANFSIKTDCTRPVVSPHSKIDLIKARHPLLQYHTQDKETIVPNDFRLDQSRQVLIITGPNTGGKTVALKTAGLLVLLAQSGLHIPADANSEIGIFGNVFADIGDEQSIELSLSTFSSHIRQIIYAVTHAGPDSLVLLDEIGAGTDPKEGAALAEAIILRMIDLKAKLIATTHYTQLKTLPTMHPEAENASFEFDRESLRPTFRLYTGIPGGSYAVEIAQRLGMPEEITGPASQLLGKGERSLTNLISDLEKELSALRDDKISLEEKLRSAGDLEAHYNRQIDKLENEVDEIKKEHLEELETTLNESRAEIEKLVKSIKESKASKETVKRAHHFLAEKRQQLDKLKARHMPKTTPVGRLEKGDTVLILSLRKEGEFVEYTGEDRARVRIGNMMSTVNTGDLKKIVEDEDHIKRMRGRVNVREVTAPGPELHLRGMTVEEAKEALDKFLDSAILHGLTQIYVIHGKGTGTLRKQLSQFLKAHSAVASFRLGDWNEGGAGVTVVQLK
ncbi:MAG: endonuclease MutS2 [Candidatus Zixiibacteriota bacterium]|nr:MAG: endonuclease MutS2 [candidate division Zixibacteria bacterium]